MLMVALMVALSSCRLTKFVPEDQYLLNKVTIKVVDTKDVTADDLDNYLRQTQNTEILSFWKLQLQIYNTAPRDTTTKARKRLAENAYKVGEAPILYDEMLTAASIDQLRIAMNNRGYYNATVDTVTKYKDRKVNLTYVVTAGQPYRLRRYSAEFDNESLQRAANSRFSEVDSGMILSSQVLDEERQRIASSMRRHGYYYFDKTVLTYEADSALGTHEADVKLQLLPYIDALPDSVQDRLFSRYAISRVCFHMDYDPRMTPSTDQLVVEREGQYEYSFVGRRLLRNSTLRRSCAIVPGETYNESRVEQSYANLNGLGPVKYVDISFTPVGPDSLECHITLSRDKMNTVTAEAEGTFSAGDWGVAVGAGYVHKNIFRGAEQLSLRGRGSYEWRANNGRAIEATAEAALLFPSKVRVNFAYNYQKRPDEYTRTIANAGIYYSYHKTYSHWSHQFNLLDVSYIYLPWTSKDFQENFIDKSSVLKTSYENHFILDWSYRGSYSGYNQRFPNRSYVNFSYTLETAGNVLYAISAAAQVTKDEHNQYMLFKIPFSQYAKADMDFAYHQILVPNHELVYHVGLGVAVPYLNAATIPFEKRYFSGGANSVRGWQARTLGPGSFRGLGNARVYDLQTGDVRLDMNVEYRYKVISWVELAAFMDAGNIWTIHDYQEQPGGVLSKDFVKQIAWSYGVGLRLDLSFVIFRLDLGVKLHDPTRIAEGRDWRTIPNGLNWKNDMTLHFAIGYPF